MTSAAERLQILERLEKGEINPNEATRLLSESEPRATSPMDILKQLEGGEMNADEAARRLAQAKDPIHGESASDKKSNFEILDATGFISPARTWGWWLLPIAAGIVVMLLAALWMANSLGNRGLGLAFFFAWVPFAIGLLLVVVGWAVRQGHWVHIRVSSQKPGRHLNFNLNLPLPIQLVTGPLRPFGVYIPGFDEESVKKMVGALHESRRNGNPLHIRASEDDDETVDIVIS